jgi:hypothetical protein
MSSVTYEQVLQLVGQLSPADQQRLAEHLQRDGLGGGKTITREQILHEQAQRLAQGYEPQLLGLVGLFPRPDLDLSFEDIEAAIHENSWEDELDEFFGDA